MAAPDTICALAKTDSSVPRKPVALSASTSHASVAPEKNVKPRPSRIEAIAQPEKPGPDLPHDQVQQGRDQERRRAQQEREPAAAGVGDHPGRDLEQHLADREERVDREGLRVVEAGVEQEQRVDAPDERGSQRREQGQDEIGPLDRARRVAHGRGF